MNDASAVLAQMAQPFESPIPLPKGVTLAGGAVLQPPIGHELSPTPAILTAHRVWVNGDVGAMAAKVAIWIDVADKALAFENSAVFPSRQRDEAAVCLFEKPTPADVAFIGEYVRRTPKSIRFMFIMPVDGAQHHYVGILRIPRKNPRVSVMVRGEVETGPLNSTVEAYYAIFAALKEMESAEHLHVCLAFQLWLVGPTLNEFVRRVGEGISLKCAELSTRVVAPMQETLPSTFALLNALAQKWKPRMACLSIAFDPTRVHPDMIPLLEMKLTISVNAGWTRVGHTRAFNEWYKPPIPLMTAIQQDARHAVLTIMSAKCAGPETAKRTKERRAIDDARLDEDVMGRVLQWLLPSFR